MLDGLKEEMLQEREAALQVLNTAVNDAVQKCMAAVEGIPMDEGEFTAYILNIAEKEIDKQQDFNGFLNEFRVDADTDDEDGGKGQGKDKNADKIKGDDEDEEDDD